MCDDFLIRERGINISGCACRIEETFAQYTIPALVWDCTVDYILKETEKEGILHLPLVIVQIYNVDYFPVAILEFHWVIYRQLSDCDPI